MELEGFVLTADADQIRRLIKVIDTNSKFINFAWLEQWLAGYYQSMMFAGGEEEDATPEVVLAFLEGITGLGKIFT